MLSWKRSGQVVWRKFIVVHCRKLLGLIIKWVDFKLAFNAFTEELGTLGYDVDSFEEGMFRQ